MYVLGISAFYHDSAACLVKDGVIIAAAQEERFSRKKHDDAVPVQAVKYCLYEAGITISDVDQLVFYDKPFLKFERIIKNYLQGSPRGYHPFVRALMSWGKRKLWLKEWLRKDFNYKGEILFLKHHEAHSASAFFPSPFEKAAILTIDGVGEWTTTSIGVGKGSRIKLLEEIHYPHSLGLLYSAFTYFCGFKVNSGEYKLMGLAPYGEPIYKELILEKLVDLKSDGSFGLVQKYFNYSTGLTMTSPLFSKLFGGPPRQPESQITQREMDIAASIQLVTEEIVLGLAKRAKQLTGEKYLCLAGGVALNCVANGKLLRSKLFEDIWIQPAAGDAGGALGSALFAWFHLSNKAGEETKRKVNISSQNNSCFGPTYSDEQIKKFLKDNSIKYEKLSTTKLPTKIAQLIDTQQVIGLFQGRMEYGPRALGNRSIIGDARSSKMQEIMNQKIKFRESFRPFAPAVLWEQRSRWFDIDSGSPYMLLTARVKNAKLLEVNDNKKGFEKLKQIRSQIPAVTHVDGSARLQTVAFNYQQNGSRYYDIIKAFYDLTGCPVIINTSFNVRGEPIVCSPKDAYSCFVKTEMDYLLLGSFLIKKKGLFLTGKELKYDSPFVLGLNKHKGERKRALLVSSLFLVAGGISAMFFQGIYLPRFLLLATLTFVFGFVFPQVLQLVILVVAKLSGIVGSLIVTILLTLYYWLFFVPLALLLKLFGETFLDNEIKKTGSYWLESESNTAEDYTKQA